MPGRFIDATPFADYETYMRYAPQPKDKEQAEQSQQAEEEEPEMKKEKFSEPPPG